MPSTRRHFLQSATAAGLYTSALAGQEKKISANDRVQVATIGLGGMGTEDTHSSTKVPGVELVAVADIYQGRLIMRQRAFSTSNLFTTRDYREVLARKDIDAVHHRHARPLARARSPSTP